MEQKENGGNRRKVWRRLLRKLPTLLLGTLITLVLLLIYEFAVRLVWQPMFWIYFAALAALSLGYTVYNRGFSRTRVSRNDLPRTWSEAEKDEFFADAARRKAGSRWMLFLIVPLALVFVYDTVALFFGDFIEYIFPFVRWPR